NLAPTVHLGGPAAAPAPRRRPPGPPRDRRPAVFTALAVALITIVVVVASVVAARNDVRGASPPPATTVVPAPSSATADRIAFTTSSGTGVLRITDHAWDSDGYSVSEPGSLLTVVIELTCESGNVGYGPDSFSAFDQRGDLVDAEMLPDSPTGLEVGTLSAGQRVRGTVAFDILRGGVTLLMSDEGSRTVTALRVPD
ncbi:MAG: hypothetical protein L0H24_13305, partial [Microlunatus sp.]|nr:hypothetical protein [Microlunatus sp.]